MIHDTTYMIHENTRLKEEASHKKTICNPFTGYVHNRKIYQDRKQISGWGVGRKGKKWGVTATGGGGNCVVCKLNLNF